jgi:hypothetical protein
MKRIGLISDTHSYMDDRILHHLEGCDQIWHAGDIGSSEVMEPLHEIAEVKAVYGNIDDAGIRANYPLDQIFETGGAKVFITHIAGRPNRYPRRVKDRIAVEKPDIFVCGHSHILLVNRDPDTGLIHMNPGACGNHGFHKVRTLLRFSINQGKVIDPEVIELGKRGR